MQFIQPCDSDSDSDSAIRFPRCHESASPPCPSRRKIHGWVCRCSMQYLQLGTARARSRYLLSYSTILLLTSLRRLIANVNESCDGALIGSVSWLSPWKELDRSLGLYLALRRLRLFVGGYGTPAWQGRGSSPASALRRTKYFVRCFRFPRAWERWGRTSWGALSAKNRWNRGGPICDRNAHSKQNEMARYLLPWANYLSQDLMMRGGGSCSWWWVLACFPRLFIWGFLLSSSTLWPCTEVLAYDINVLFPTQKSACLPLCTYCLCFQFYTCVLSILQHAFYIQHRGTYNALLDHSRHNPRNSPRLHTNMDWELRRHSSQHCQLGILDRHAIQRRARSLHRSRRQLPANSLQHPPHRPRKNRRQMDLLPPRIALHLRRLPRQENARSSTPQARPTRCSTPGHLARLLVPRRRHPQQRWLARLRRNRHFREHWRQRYGLWNNTLWC